MNATTIGTATHRALRHGVSTPVGVAQETGAGGTGSWPMERVADCVSDGPVSRTFTQPWLDLHRDTASGHPGPR